MKEINDERIDTLFKAVLELKTVDECRRFFTDLCTISELKSMSQRMEVALMLKDKNIYTDIAAKMNSYTDFAYIYDSLMHKDIDYEKWADYIENLFIMYDVNPDLVCDLACGTGNITIPLAKRGYDMTGVDISEDMLNIAREKADGLDILFLNQSMTDLDLFGTMGAFLCMIDGINYVLPPKSLLTLFTKIKTCFIDPDGLFIFDISTEYKLKNVIGSNTFVHSDKNIFYTWQNRFIEKRKLSDMFLTFFVKQGKKYSRFEERHLQRAYSVNELTLLLKKAGFKSVDTYDELSFDKPKKDSERIVFVCR